MLAKRMPLLWVFAGGCLSGAALIHFSRGDAEAVPSPTRDAVEQVTEVPPLATASASEAPTLPADTVDSRPAEPHAEPALADKADIVDGPAAEPGHSVAEVLAGLEAQYREGLIAAAPPTPSSTRDGTTPTASNAATAPAAADVPSPTPAPAAAPGPALAALTETPPREVPAREEPRVTVLAAATPVPPPQNVQIGSVHIGDVHQNNSVTNVQQTDAYLLQQLALLQNLQLLALSPYARLAPPASPARRPNGTTRRAPPFPTSLTNPDNPWGFDFPPTILAK